MHIKLPYAFQTTGKVPGTRRMDRVIASDWLTLNILDERRKASAVEVAEPMLTSMVNAAQ